MIRTFNGLALPGFDMANPKFPRVAIVWDANGWTAPVRRIVTGFNGKFTDTDGNTWDYSSDIPYEYRSLRFADWNTVPENLIADPGERAWTINARLMQDMQPEHNW